MNDTLIEFLIYRDLSVIAYLIKFNKWKDLVC